MKPKSYRKGGVHPSERKHFTVGKAIERMALPKEAVIPLLQHTGAMCEPEVRAKDEVLAGQRVGKSTGFISAPVHASVSGTVRAVEPRLHPSGRMVPCVVIESDGEDRWVELRDDPDYANFSPDEIRAIVSDAGVVGMGGAAFPTHVKLSPPENKPIDTVILNGAECEPYLTGDHRLMLERTEDALAGLRIIMHVLGVKRAFVAIENNKQDAFEAFEALLKGEADIEPVLLRVLYPQGAEKQLIKTLLDREIPSGGLPMDVGALVHNVGTALAIYEAVRFGKPLVERVTSVTGGAVVNPKNLLVRIGTSLADVIEECGGTNGAPAKVVLGGPMMGVAQASLDVPLVKATSGVLVLERQEVVERVEKQCIRCGSCLRACPMMLMPNMLGDLAEHGMYDRLGEYNIFDCIECGSCTYVCPTDRRLVQWIRFGKLQAKKAS